MNTYSRTDYSALDSVVEFLQFPYFYIWQTKKINYYKKESLNAIKAIYL